MPFTIFPQAGAEDPLPDNLGASNAWGKNPDPVFLQADFSARFVVASSSFDKSAGQHYAGFYQLQAGEPLRWVCQSNEIKYLVEGAHEVRDVKSGQTGIARAGDAMFLEKGSTVIYTPIGAGAKGFYVVQEPAAQSDPSKL